MPLPPLPQCPSRGVPPLVVPFLSALPSGSPCALEYPPFLVSFSCVLGGDNRLFPLVPLTPPPPLLCSSGPPCDRPRCPLSPLRIPGSAPRRTAPTSPPGISSPPLGCACTHTLYIATHPGLSVSLPCPSWSAPPGPSCSLLPTGAPSCSPLPARPLCPLRRRPPLSPFPWCPIRTLTLTLSLTLTLTLILTLAPPPPLSLIQAQAPALPLAPSLSPP